MQHAFSIVISYEALRYEAEVRQTRVDYQSAPVVHSLTSFSGSYGLYQFGCESKRKP